MTPPPPPPPRRIWPTSRVRPRNHPGIGALCKRGTRHIADMGCSSLAHDGRAWLMRDKTWHNEWLRDGAFTALSPHPGIGSTLYTSAHKCDLHLVHTSSSLSPLSFPVHHQHLNHSSPYSPFFSLSTPPPPHKLDGVHLYTCVLSGIYTCQGEGVSIHICQTLV